MECQTENAERRGVAVNGVGLLNVMLNVNVR
jgi:hypothetical protein